LFKVVTKVLATQSVDLLLSNRLNRNWTTTTSRRLFKFSAPENESTPEPSPKRKPNPEVVTSGESDFKSATRESPAPEPTRRLIDMIEGPPQVDTERTRTEFAKYLEGGPQDKIEEHNLLLASQI
jgi:hypothetical protein